jgi:hypothetical protein
MLTLTEPSSVAATFGGSIDRLLDRLPTSASWQLMPIRAQ